MHPVVKKDRCCKTYYSFCELREKEVVNVNDGRRLGFITDLEFDIVTGRITKLVLPPQCKYFSLFSSKESICIPWDCVEKIGDDIILVHFIECCPTDDCKN